MGKRADEIKTLTSDRGAQRLAVIVDDLEAQLASLQARVNVCCPEVDVNKKPAKPE